MNRIHFIPQEMIEHWTLQLHKEFAAICFHFRLDIRKPLIRLDTLKGKWGLWEPTTRSIILSLDLIQKYAWDVVLEIFKHEIAHMVVDEIERCPQHGHGEIFRTVCQRLGMSPWAQSASVDLGQPILIDRTSQLGEKEQQLLRRTQKLLALAESSNEHEAMLAIQRVREIYEKYNLDALENGRHDEYTYININHHQKIIPQHQSLIAQILQQHFFVDVIFSQLYDASSNVTHKIMEIMGSNENVLMAEYVYQFLWQSLPQLWDNFRRSHKLNNKTRRSYYLGVLYGFDEKLKQNAAASIMNPMATDSGARLPIEIKRSLAILERRLKEYVQYRHPRLVTRRWGGTHVDGNAFDAGKKAGRELTLHRPLTGKQNGTTPTGKPRLLESGH